MAELCKENLWHAGIWGHLLQALPCNTSLNTYRGFMSGQNAHRLAITHVPQAHCAVTGASAHVVPIGMPSHDIHICVVPCSVHPCFDFQGICIGAQGFKRRCTHLMLAIQMRSLPVHHSKACSSLTSGAKGRRQHLPGSAVAKRAP